MKNLTARYSATQFSYWAASTCATSFATAFLLQRGLPAGLVGTLLAVGGLLSCLSQPVIAARADRARSYAVNRYFLLLCAISSLCFAVQLLPVLPPLASGLFYLVGIWATDAIIPLLNTVSVAYEQAGHPINFGAARGIGSVASALSTLVAGYLFSGLGSSYMIGFILLFRLVSMLILLGYPKIQKPAIHRQQDRSCSIGQFFRQYRWYCASLLGILFLGMYLAMTENYLIAILGQLGGDSSHVGTALSIASLSSAPVIFFFSKIRARLSDTRLLKLAALSFLLRAVLFALARSIPAIYAIQLLHTTSYAFLAPTQVYYAESRIPPADMVKGQAFVTAAYALGCSAGNLAGGLLLPSGANAILLAGILMALTGTVILFLTVEHADRKTA